MTGGVVKMMGKGTNCTNWANAGNWAKQLDGMPESLQATLHWTAHWTVVFSTGREFVDNLKRSFEGWIYLLKL